tara:strand:- start:2500 stop:3762 length:1263 start_codon:yes stop_codon:yes gene_type:complete
MPKPLSIDRAVDKHLKPVKDSDGTLTALEISTDTVRVKDLVVSGTTSGVSDDTKLPLTGGTITGNTTIGTDAKLQFVDGDEFIASDGTDMFITSGGDVTVSADGGNITMNDGTNTIFDFDVDEPALTIKDDADADDYFKIAVAANGDSTISTNSDGIASANLTIFPDGNIALKPATDQVTIYSTTGSNNVVLFSGEENRRHRFYSNADAADYMELAIAASGETTISTVDDGAAIAHLNLVADGNVAIKCNPSGRIDLMENDGSTYTPDGDSNATTKLYVDTGDAIKVATVTISEAEMNALHTTEKVLVAAQGAGKVIIPISAIFFVDRDASTAQATSSNMCVSMNGSTTPTAGLWGYIKRFMYNESGDRILGTPFSGGEIAQAVSLGDNVPLTAKLTAAITSGSIDSVKVVTAYYVYDNS